MSGVVDDGFNVWDKCVRRGCNLEVVRPGKVQCDGEYDLIGCPHDLVALADNLYDALDAERAIADRLAVALDAHYGTGSPKPDEFTLRALDAYREARR